MVYVYLLCSSLILLLFFLSRNYKKDEIRDLDHKKYPLKMLYPTGLFVMDMFIKKIPFGNNIDATYKVSEALDALHIGEKSEVLKRIYQCKKIVIVSIIFFLTNVMSLISLLQDSPHINLMEGQYLQRADYGKGDNSVDLQVKVADNKELILDEEMRIKISERQITAEEINELLRRGITYIDSVILLDNKDFDAIKSDLFLPSSIPSKGIKVSWSTEDKNIIDGKGNLSNENLKMPQLLWVKATLKLENQEIIYTRYFKIYPKEYSKEELLQKQLRDEIEKNNKKTLTQDNLSLPTKVGEKDIVWSLSKKKHENILFILGVIAAGLIYIGMDKDLWAKVNKRNQKMLLDYPDIINKFTLLVGAGMSLSNAWNKIAKDYCNEGKVYKYAYEEMNITARELSIGASEITAYERFGRRVKLLPYLRFSSLLAQSVKKGSKDLLEQLELESINAFAERKENAKRLGEEAGTKLLMPMMFMLVLILAIILIPAFLSLQL